MTQVTDVREGTGAGVRPGVPVRSRMGITVLSLIGIFVSGYLTLYHLGGIGTLQCGLAGGCDVVQTSRYAMFLGIPVAMWGVGGYAAIFAVALLGLQPRWSGAPWVGFALMSLSTVALIFSGYLTWLEAAVIHAWCQWCVVSAVLVLLIFLLSLPGLRRATDT